MWWKFASTSTTAVSDDPYIIFEVDTGGFGGSETNGILFCHCRTSSPITSTNEANFHMIWTTANGGIKPEKFEIAYKIAEGKVDIELWCECASWTYWHFNVLSEGNRTIAKTGTWTLYNSQGQEGNNITQGFTHKSSTLATIINPINSSSITGVLPVKNGGTGKDSLPAGQVLIGAGTDAVTNKIIRNRKTKGSVISYSKEELLNTNDLAFWNGTYSASETDATSSNLEYCIKGQFGDIVTHNNSEYAIVSHNHDNLYLKLTGGNVTGQITATAFNGNLKGTATTAETANKTKAALTIIQGTQSIIFDGSAAQNVTITSSGGMVSGDFVPVTRKINQKTLETDITLTATDVQALPITGGTVTGLTQFPQGTITYGPIKAGSGKAGWVIIATIKISEKYNNAPITIEIVRRAMTSRATVSIRFHNDSTVDPELDEFYYEGGNDYNLHLYKKAASTWELWVQKEENYGVQNILYFNNPNTGITVTWSSTYSESAPPSEATKAKPLYSLSSHTHENYVPTSRKINNKALTGDINLVPTDIGAAAASHTHNEYVPTSRTINNKPLTGNITLGATDVGAAATNHTHKLNLIGDITGSATLGNTDVNLTTARRRCIVGNQANSAKTPWWKFASVTVTTIQADPYIIFNVTSSGFGSTELQGILFAHFRSENPLTNTTGFQMMWLTANSGIDINNFKYAYKITATSVEMQLWCSCNPWVAMHFTVLSEGDRTNFNTPWTLYNGITTEGTSFPTDFTVKPSTLATVINPVKAASITDGNDTWAAKTHTHDDLYLKKADKAASAGSADTLGNMNVGNTMQPVYFSNGKPVVAKAYPTAFYTKLNESEITALNNANSLVTFITIAAFQYDKVIDLLIEMQIKSNLPDTNKNQKWVYPNFSPAVDLIPFPATSTDQAIIIKGIPANVSLSRGNLSIELSSGILADIQGSQFHFNLVYISK